MGCTNRPLALTNSECHQKASATHSRAPCLLKPAHLKSPSMYLVNIFICDLLFCNYKILASTSRDTQDNSSPCSLPYPLQLAQNKLFLTLCEMRAMFSMSYTNTIGMKLNARLSAGPEMLPAQRSTSISFLWYQQPGLGSASCQLGLLLGHSQPCTPACSEWLRAANWSREKGLKRHVVVAPRRRQ